MKCDFCRYIDGDRCPKHGIYADKLSIKSLGRFLNRQIARAMAVIILFMGMLYVSSLIMSLPFRGLEIYDIYNFLIGLFFVGIGGIMIYSTI